MQTTNVDAVKVDAFAATMITHLNGAALALMTSLGHRTGLFDAMAELPPSTSRQIADAAGLNERYVREWLGAMVTGGVVEYDPAANTYRLPPEHAAFLTRAASPNNIAASMQWVAVLGAVEDEVAEAFRHGQGVPYSAYRRFHEVMAEESDQTIVAGLEAHILPLVPGLTRPARSGHRRARRRLRVGPGAADAGGAVPGEPVRRLRLLRGGDRGAPSRGPAAQACATSASRSATWPGWTNRGAFDLVTAFDAIHDQADPAGVLRNIAPALRPGGVFLMQDIKASQPRLPATRTCRSGRSSTRSRVCTACRCRWRAAGRGSGAAWGKELALRMLAEAGFTDDDGGRRCRTTC